MATRTKKKPVVVAPAPSTSRMAPHQPNGTQPSAAEQELARIKAKLARDEEELAWHKQLEANCAALHEKLEADEAACERAREQKKETETAYNIAVVKLRNAVAGREEKLPLIDYANGKQPSANGDAEDEGAEDAEVAEQPVGWEAAPIEDLHLPKKLAAKIAAAGLTTAGELDADLALAGTGVTPQIAEQPMTEREYDRIRAALAKLKEAMAWETTPIVELGLPRKLFKKLVDMGITTAGMLDFNLSDGHIANDNSGFTDNDLERIHDALVHVRVSSPSPAGEAWKSEPANSLHSCSGPVAGALHLAGVKTLGQLDDLLHAETLTDAQRAALKDVRSETITALKDELKVVKGE